MKVLVTVKGHRVEFRKLFKSASWCKFLTTNKSKINKIQGAKGFIGIHPIILLT